MIVGKFALKDWGEIKDKLNKLNFNINIEEAEKFVYFIELWRFVRRLIKEAISLRETKVLIENVEEGQVVIIEFSYEEETAKFVINYY